MEHNYLQTLGEIRSMMERSSRFISLSGLSGIGAGIAALAGATLAYLYLDKLPFDNKVFYEAIEVERQKWNVNFITFFILDAVGVAVFAISLAIFFTTRKAKRKGQKIWDRLTLRLLVNLAVPIFTGGVFCLALLYHHFVSMVAPATLVFYGLGLVNASKYTLNDIRYLGLLEILLGLIAAFFIGYGLEFWTIGFGLLHIVYGAFMYWKYERNE